MIRIENVSSNYMEDLEAFIKEIPSIKDVDMNILNNASLVIEDDEIVGTLAFEQFANKGLVRYFIFKKTLEEDTVIDLFKSMEGNAIISGIKKIYCIATDENIYSLFKNLGFNKIDENFLYIDEQSVLNEKYNDTIFMGKEIH